MSWVLAAQAISILWSFVTITVGVLVDIPVAVLRLLLLQPDVDEAGHCVFYEGEVAHTRKKPLVNSFTYPVRMAVVELDDPPKWWSSQAPDHFSAEAARTFAGTTGKVKILTHPYSAGYVQNPISVYYCYSAEGKLDICIAEVTNTPWGERVTFLFDPAGQTVPKALHVSPMMDMQNIWHLKALPPGEQLAVSVTITHPEMGAYFEAHLVAKRCSGPTASQSNESAGWATLLRYGYQPQRVAWWIYAQAVILLMRGCPFYNPPGEAFKARATRQATHRKSTAGELFRWRGPQGWVWNWS